MSAIVKSAGMNASRSVLPVFTINLFSSTLESFKLKSMLAKAGTAHQRRAKVLTNPKKPAGYFRPSVY